MTFAHAKIRPPRLRTVWTAREALDRHLHAALLERRLVLLVAPAGYGKTAALSRQLQSLPPGCIALWLRADEEDDLPRFVSCRCEALEPHDPPWRKSPEALAESAARAGRGRRDAAPWGRGRATASRDPHTVKRHVARILERLDVSSRDAGAAGYRSHLQDTGAA
ncbi:hypothetical protein [Variovorax sp. PBL-E5]|uniref:hypothetical protein n=2 Tax=unclassified Variovorax TaxID=663243 RepID=UPI0013A5B8FB|nr:hypothetical protein [Variovorax sp. PBL-E5]